MNPPHEQSTDEMALDDAATEAREEDRAARPEKRGDIDPEAALIAVSPSRLVDSTRRRRGSGWTKKESKEVIQMRARRQLSWRMPKPMYDGRTHYTPVGMGFEQEYDHVSCPPLPPPRSIASLLHLNISNDWSY